ncbi:MAG: hypothetical protein P8N63_03160 [Pseudomonadales bacterium]|nr:hypothetical protein [Pseudomonadales bacterium]
MNELRTRVRSNVSAAVLTLLGIIQALALEQLWTHVLITDALYTLTWQTFTSWTQIVTTLTAIILVWLVYAANVTRFLWLPSIYEFILPFWVGFVQVLMIQVLTPTNIGFWFILMGVLFGTMIWIAQSTLRKARLDGSNEAFFATISAATWSDFLPAIAIIGLILTFGLYAANFKTGHLVNLSMLLILLSFAYIQFRTLRMGWQRSMSPDDNPSPPPDPNGPNL